MPRWLRELILWAGAVLGGICLLWTVTIATTGLVPLVFMSGSMSPAINTGDLAFARTEPSSALRVGDIVSVETRQGVRVTHRIVEFTPATGQSVGLTLRGDANASPDAESYTVETADRVVAVVPKAGYLLNAAATPWAWLFGGALVAAALFLGFSHRTPPDPEPEEGPSAPTDPPRRSAGPRPGPAEAHLVVHYPRRRLVIGPEV